MSQTVTPPSLPQLTDARLTLEGRVATLTLDRHDVRNALTGTALTDDIVAVAQWVNACDAVSVLVITGAGSAFSAGGNVKDMAERGGDFAGDVAEVSARYRRGIQRIPLALQAVEVPIIAAVNGPAIGAGFDLANMADIRIASKKAKFGETFLNLGIIPGDGGAWFMQRLIGYQRAFELTLSGRVIDAEEAKEYDIVLEVTEPEALMETAGELAARIAAQPPKATRLTKRLMKMAQRTELKDFLDLCAVFQGMCHNEPEHLEAVNAMLEKMAK
ncbi:enoyl-CoA hydratase-related protein [Halomonas mongoliensis]|uniref:enoyl-CoA hydratase-related protein n=1 Tax=Halomonas mongoliensis TaxID=321265 RepID=UPI00403A811D